MASLLLLFLFYFYIFHFSGEETRVIPRILDLRARWRKDKKESKRLEEAGVTDEVLDAAISAFVIEVCTYII